MAELSFGASRKRIFSVGLAAEVMLTFSSLVPETSPLTTSLSVVPFNDFQRNAGIRLSGVIAGNGCRIVFVVSQVSGADQIQVAGIDERTGYGNVFNFGGIQS